MWNVFERSLNGEDRTNNFAEAVHHHSDETWGESSYVVELYESALESATWKRCCFKTINYWARGIPEIERILYFLRNYANRSKIEYLRGLAHNFQME